MGFTRGFCGVGPGKFFTEGREGARVWNLACSDWAERIRTGGSLIPELPLNRVEAEHSLAIYNRLCLPDVPGKPSLAEAGGRWFAEIVATCPHCDFSGPQQRPTRGARCDLPSGRSARSADVGPAKQDTSAFAAVAALGGAALPRRLPKWPSSSKHCCSCRTAKAASVVEARVRQSWLRGSATSVTCRPGGAESCGSCPADGDCRRAHKALLGARRRFPIGSSHDSSLEDAV